ASPKPGPRPPGFLSLTDLIAAVEKPVIAAINGLCMGGGFELSLACDLRIAGRYVDAIGLPETRIGIFPGGGGTQRLPRVVGEAKALEIILRGLTFNADEALAIGLVHELDFNPVTRALVMAAEWDGRGAEGIAFAKRLTRAAAASRRARAGRWNAGGRSPQRPASAPPRARQAPSTAAGRPSAGWPGRCARRAVRGSPAAPPPRPRRA